LWFIFIVHVKHENPGFRDFDFSLYQRAPLLTIFVLWIAERPVQSVLLTEYR
jgi:hypothetical protein